MIPPPLTSTLFPYTTLFRSACGSTFSGSTCWPPSFPAWAPSKSAAPASIPQTDRKSTRLNSSHGYISYAVFRLKKKTCLDFRLADPQALTDHAHLFAHLQTM